MKSTGVRRFRDVEYELYDTYFQPDRARAMATQLRADGYRVRLVPDRNDIALYVRRAERAS